MLCLPLTASIVPFIRPSVQGPCHPCYLRVHSHPPLGLLLMSLSATLSLANIIVGDNNIVPRETPSCCGPIVCSLDLCVSKCVSWNTSPMRCPSEKKKGFYSQISLGNAAYQSPPLRNLPCSSKPVSVRHTKVFPKRQNDLGPFKISRSPLTTCRTLGTWTKLLV